MTSAASAICGSMASSARSLSVLAMLTAIILSDGCHLPTTDRRLLTAATKDAFSLLAEDGPKGPLEPRHWSVNLLRLRPERILVRERGVEIVTQSYFDGG